MGLALMIPLIVLFLVVTGLYDRRHNVRRREIHADREEKRIQTDVFPRTQNTSKTAIKQVKADTLNTRGNQQTQKPTQENYDDFFEIDEDFFKDYSDDPFEKK